MLVFRLAWRSFLRHRWRSIITGFAISLGLALMLISLGMAADGHRRMIEIGVRLGSGHVLVQGKGFQEEQSLDHLVTNPKRVMDVARALPGVSMVVPRVRASGLLSAGGSSSAVGVGGVDPTKEPAVSSIAAKKGRVAGDYLRPRAQLPFENLPGDIYVGKDLAGKLALSVDDRVVLTVSPRGGGKPASAAFRVRGVFKTGLAELDGFYVEIELAEADKLLRLDGSVTQVAVLLDEQDNAHVAAQQLEAALADDTLEVLPWQVALKELYEAIVLDDWGGYLMMLIIFVIVAIGIFNTMLMSVVERTRQFGVMMAVGTSGRRLFATVLTEAFILGLVAASVGLAIGLSLHAWMAHSGLDMSQFYGEDAEMAGIVFDGRIYSYLTFSVVAKATSLVVGLVVVSAIYPAYRATRLEPVEAMRHV